MRTSPTPKPNTNNKNKAMNPRGLNEASNMRAAIVLSVKAAVRNESRLSHRQPSHCL